jgi:predicted transcriptional regulator
MDFACKKFDLEEVVKCSFGLTKSEFSLLKFLIKSSGEFTTEQLAERLNLDKSTIQRAVKKLHSKGLVFRGQINLSGGGYVFWYRIKEKEKIRKMIIDIIESWVEVFRNRIKNW